MTFHIVRRLFVLATLITIGTSLVACRNPLSSGPNVAFSLPLENATVGGSSVYVSLLVSGGDGPTYVYKVEVDDSIVIYTNTGGERVWFNWDTRSLPNGQHKLTAIVQDESGHKAMAIRMVTIGPTPCSVDKIIETKATPKNTVMHLGDNLELSASFEPVNTSSGVGIAIVRDQDGKSVLVNYFLHAAQCPKSLWIWIGLDPRNELLNFGRGHIINAVGLIFKPSAPPARETDEVIWENVEYQMPITLNDRIE